MNFENTMHDSLWRYPTMFLKDEYYEYRVMGHLFFVIGNGFDWKNGQLVINYPRKKKSPSWQKFLNKAIRGYYSYKKRIEFLYKNMPTLNLSKRYFYPASEGYSLAFEVPDDVKQDWLAAVIHYLEYAKAAPIDDFIYDAKTYDVEKKHALKLKKVIDKHLIKLKKLMKKEYGKEYYG